VGGNSGKEQNDDMTLTWAITKQFKNPDGYRFAKKYIVAEAQQRPLYLMTALVPLI